MGKFLLQNPNDPRRYDVVEYTDYGTGDIAGWGWTWLTPLILSTILFWFVGGQLWSVNHLQWSGACVAVGLFIQTQWMREFWRYVFCIGIAASPVILCIWGTGFFHWLWFIISGHDLTRK